MSIEDLFKDTIPAMSEGSKSETETEVKEEAKKEDSKEADEIKEEVKEVIPDKHHDKWVELVCKMNDLMDGRLEADIPMNDPYWAARNELHVHQAAKR